MHERMTDDEGMHGPGAVIWPEAGLDLGKEDPLHTPALFSTNIVLKHVRLGIYFLLMNRTPKQGSGLSTHF